MKPFVTSLLIAAAGLVLAGTAARAELPSVAVVDFTATQPTPVQAQLADLIAEELVNSGRFDVLEREKMASVLNEQAFQSSGLADLGTAVAFGKLVGAHYLVSGNIQDFGTETSEFNGYGVRTRTTVFRLAASLKVFDVRTGRVLFSKTETAEDSDHESRNSRTNDTTTGNRLAGVVAGKLAKALLASKAFGAPKSTEVVTCTVRVESTPAGADVEVDGVFIGNAGGPLQLPEGLHSVVISLPGHLSWSKKVQVREGLAITARLEKQPDVPVPTEEPAKASGG